MRVHAHTSFVIAVTLSWSSSINPLLTDLQQAARQVSGHSYPQPADVPCALWQHRTDAAAQCFNRNNTPTVFTVVTTPLSNVQIL
jgi:hypothetical protein